MIVNTIHSLNCTSKGNDFPGIHSCFIEALQLRVSLESLSSRPETTCFELGNGASVKSVYHIQKAIAYMHIYVHLAGRYYHLLVIFFLLSFPFDSGWWLNCSQTLSLETCTCALLWARERRLTFREAYTFKTAANLKRFEWHSSLCLYRNTCVHSHYQ